MQDLSFAEFEDRSAKVATLAAVAAIVLSVLFSTTIYILASNRQSALDTAKRKVDELTLQITRLRQIDEQFQALSQGIPAFEGVLARQVDWAGFWQEIAATQVKGNYYTNFSLDDERKIRVDGIAPSLVTVAKQVKALKGSQAFEDVSVVSTSTSATSVNFGLSFKVDTSKFKVAK